MRRRLLDHTYKKIVTGNPAIAKSVARMHPDISFPGKTEQQQTTGAQVFDISKYNHRENIFVVNPGDYYEYISAENEEKISITKGFTFKENTQYTLSWDKIDIINPVDNWSIILGFCYTDGTHNDIYTYWNNNTISRSGKTVKFVYCRNPWKVGQETSQIMINEGTTALPWEPYTGGKPSPSPEYKQDIVNAQSPVQVEISDGGENIQTVTITSDRPITKWDKLVKQNNVWGWLYSGKIVDDFASLIPEKIDIYGNPGGKYFNFKIQDFKNVNYDTSKMITEVGFEKSANAFKYQPFPGINAIGILVNDDDNRETIIPNMHFKAIYQSDSTEFVPLSQEEQTMLNALHTNNPTTVVQNSIGTDITLTYKTKRSLEVAQ